MGKDSPRTAGSRLAGLGEGSRIAGYRLEEQIGQGGMAVVFRARDERLRRLVALKILTPALAADESFRERFIRESRAAAAVDHPHSIPVYEAGEAEGVLFIAMRYVPGGDVRSLVRQDGVLAQDQAAAIISAVASALDAAHAAGLVHRDVKPANMLLDIRPDRRAHVYLSDFGLSKGVASSAGVTRAGEFLGTPEYSAPEQVSGDTVDERSDQYALACTAFELLAGAPPFQRDQSLAVLWAQVMEPPPSLTSRRADLPGQVDAVFARALAKDPTERYGSCGEFAKALAEVLGAAVGEAATVLWPGSTPLPDQETGTIGMARGRRRKAVSLMVVGLGIVTFAGTATAVARLSDGPGSAAPASTPGASTAESRTYAETVGGETHTWTDYATAGGSQGAPISAYATVRIACKVTGFKVADGNDWWYRIASRPWSDTHYASADAFYNNGSESGSLAGTPWVDSRVPDCAR